MSNEKKIEEVKWSHCGQAIKIVKIRYAQAQRHDSILALTGWKT